MKRLNIFKLMKEDIKTIYENVPAARTGLLEVVSLLSRASCIDFHRIANKLYHEKNPLLRESLSCHKVFLRDRIHPGQLLGKKFFIDHGMGVVYRRDNSPTSVGCPYYQGVTSELDNSLRTRKSPPSIQSLS
jgi:serine O-acetyltransferase